MDHCSTTKIAFDVWFWQLFNKFLISLSSFCEQDILSKDICTRPYTLAKVVLELVLQRLFHLPIRYVKQHQGNKIYLFKSLMIYTIEATLISMNLFSYCCFNILSTICFVFFVTDLMSYLQTLDYCFCILSYVNDIFRYMQITRIK